MEKIGRYQVTGELGKGAMGVVYRALDPTIGREVALKTMRLDVAGMETQELLQRFRNEARAAGGLNHPNIVTIYDAGEQDGLFYIAMENIQGETLQAMLAERHVLPVEQLIGIARQICAGLDYAHARHIVHRDIKPANIMITGDGTVKIMDFGIAKAGGGVTNTGQVLGTPNYMSPEQVKGKPLDGRSDLFSVGVMLYEMLTGEKPFTGQNVTTIIYKIVNETPIPPRELDVSVHPGLSSVVTKALAKAPDERYQSGAELARDLLNYNAFGSTDEDTVVLKKVATPVMAASGAAAAAAPARSSAPAPAPAQPAAAVAKATKIAPLARPMRSRISAVTVVVGIVLLALAALGAGHLRYRTQPVQSAQPSLQAQPAPSVPEQPAAPAETKNDAIKAEPVVLGVAPNATPAAKPTTGDLYVESTPPGAQVQINGRSNPNWITPVTVTRLKPGAHTVTVSKAGHVSEIRSADVLAGERAVLAIELPTSKPVLVIGSQPEGAEVIIDDRATGMLTPADITVEKGSHTIALRRPGFEQAGTQANVSDGQRFKFAPILQQKKPDLAQIRRMMAAGAKRGLPKPGEERGHVQIRTQPKGAEIVINGFVVPRRTPFRFPLRPGTYSVTLRLEGYQPIQKQIEVTKDQLVQINERLQPR